MFIRFLRRLGLGILLLFLSSAPVLAQSPSPSALIDPIFDMPVVADGPHFFADDTVVLNDLYDGTVFAAGGEVTLNGIVDGDLVVAGGSVLISGEVLQDVYVAGGTVIIDGIVDGNVIAAGGEVRLGGNSEVGGSLIMAGDRVRSLGSVFGKLMATGRTADLAGFVGGSAMVEAGKITGQEVIEVSGDRQFSEQPEKMERQEPTTQERLAQAPLRFFFGFLWRAAFFLFFLWLLRPLVERGAELVLARPAETLLNGVAAVILIPLAVLFLMITVIGLPVAGLMFFVLITLGITGWVFLVAAAGKRVMTQGTLWQQGLVGVAFLTVIMMIPVFRWFACAVLGAWSVGIWIMLLRSLTDWKLPALEKTKAVKKKR